MEKLVYIAWKREGDSIEAFRERLVAKQGPRLLGAGAQRISVNVADLGGEIGPGAALQVMGEGASISATLSLWLECHDERAPVEEALVSITSRLVGYLVTESVPQPCRDRDWADGERSPGVTHFTAFPKPERVSDEAFYEAWYEQHTPLSFELHPRRWQYVRNAVARPITPGAPAWRALVEERFRSLEDYLDPARFFGSSEVVGRMLDELGAFADVDSMHSVPMSEYILRS